MDAGLARALAKLQRELDEVVEVHELRVAGEHLVIALHGLVALDDHGGLDRRDLLDRDGGAGEQTKYQLAV